MLTKTHKIGLNRGKRRIWIDGKALTDAGFTGGTKYVLSHRRFHNWHNNVLVLFALKDDGEGRYLSMNQQFRKVTGRPDGKPIIDIVGAIVADTFPPGVTHVDVTYEDRRIVIRPQLKEI
jgi:hypothetical protein